MGKINDAISLVKTGLEVQVSLATAEQKDLLADAKNALADLKMELADLKDENLTLKQQLKFNADVEIGKSGVAWFEKQPYCGGCFGSRGKLVPLNRYNDSQSTCPSCKATYYHLSRDSQSPKNNQPAQ